MYHGGKTLIICISLYNIFCNVNILNADDLNCNPQLKKDNFCF